MNARRMQIAALAAVIGVALLAPATVQATTLEEPLNLAGLVSAAPVIVTGVVSDVTTGQMGGLSYDAITVEVDRGIRGAAAGSTIVFRQLTLGTPQPAQEGRVYLGGLPGMPRYAQGERVLLVYPSANRDEDVFEDPFRFDIERSPNLHLAFGTGPHFCLGANLARTEIRILLEETLDRLPDIHVPEGASAQRGASALVATVDSLPVEFTAT